MSLSSRFNSAEFAAIVDEIRRSKLLRVCYFTRAFGCQSQRGCANATVENRRFHSKSPVVEVSERNGDFSPIESYGRASAKPDTGLRCLRHERNQ
jgi:hypothetical protein